MGKRRPRSSLSEIRDFVTRELLDLRALLREKVAQAKLMLRRHIRDLVLTPMEGAEGPFYQASGHPLRDQMLCHSYAFTPSSS